MQDADRLQEQVDEMTVRAEARAAVAEDHQKLVLERKATAEREIHKLRQMLEAFAMGEQFLRQRLKALSEAETPPTQIALGGVEDAVNNIVNLEQQAQRAITHNEGALAALQALEETLKQKAQDATSRARGLEVQGKRAVGVAERREESQAAPVSSGAAPLVSSSGGMSSVSGFLDGIEKRPSTT